MSLSLQQPVVAAAAVHAPSILLLHSLRRLLRTAGRGRGGGRVVDFGHVGWWCLLVGSTACCKQSAALREGSSSCTQVVGTCTRPCRTSPASFGAVVSLVRHRQSAAVFAQPVQRVESGSMMIVDNRQDTTKSRPSSQASSGPVLGGCSGLWRRRQGTVFVVAYMFGAFACTAGQPAVASSDCFVSVLSAYYKGCATTPGLAALCG